MDLTDLVRLILTCRDAADGSLFCVDTRADGRKMCESKVTLLMRTRESEHHIAQLCSSSVIGEKLNDNDTLREVPHRSNEGLALQARVSGPWPHKKESVLQVKLALLARCKYKLLWTECSAQR